MKRKFFGIGFVKSTGLAGQTPRALKYLVENRDSVLPCGLVAEMAQNIRVILKTPMAEFFDHILEAKGLSNFTSLYLLESDSSIPEVLAQTLVTLDLKQVDTSGITRSCGEISNKILTNVSGFIKRDKATGRFGVTSIDGFINQYNRGLLVASYEDSTRGWLSPYLGEFTVRTYSMILSSVITRYYNLSIPESMQVMGIFALYMSQLLDSDDGDLVYPALFGRCTFVGSRAELAALSKACAHESSKGLTLESTCNLIAELGPERLKSFDLRSLYTLACTLGPDTITTSLALEYPPYWVYILMLALSGNKIPIVYQLNNMRLASEGRSKFLSQIMSYDELFTVNRG